MIKELKSREKTNKLSCRFSAHHKSITLSPRHSDLYYQLQHGVIKLKRQNPVK